MKYFSNLHAGWADLIIEGFKGHVSYIRNVALDVLKAYEEYLIYEHCIIPFDEEDFDFNIYVDDIEVLIVRNDKFNQKQLFTIQETPASFIRNLACDIADNITEWCKWNNLENEDNDNLDNRIRNLEVICMQLGLYNTKIIDFNNFKKGV